MDNITKHYREAQLALRPGDRQYSRKIKILDGDGTGTKWLDITEEEYASIRSILLNK